MAGTGGTPAASGGTGAGGIRGTGGLGGIPVSPECEAIATQYQAALGAAESCQVGAPGQCQQIDNGPLSFCNCTVYVNDTSALDPLEAASQAAGCPTPIPCGCPTSLNNTCVATDGGTWGVCSYVPSFGTGAAGGPGTGGSVGADGSMGAGGSVIDGGPVLPVGAILYPSDSTPGAYQLAVSNVPISCDNRIPLLTCSPPATTYLIQVQVPAQDLTPGIYSLSNLLYPVFSEEVPNVGDLSSCGFGGGSLAGSLTITHVSSSEMVFGVMVGGGDFSTGATAITAQRCPPADAGP